MLWQILAIFLVLWSIVSRWKRRKMIALSKQLPMTGVALPLIGHAYMFLGRKRDCIEKFLKVGQEAIDKGGVICHWLGNRLFIVVADPAAAEVVLKTCLEKDDIVRFFKVLLGNGSILAPVHIWRPRRKILAPTFSPKNLNAFVDIFARQSGILVDKLKSATGKGPFSVWKYITAYTMDSVCETTLGIKVKAQLHPEQPFLRAFANCCRLITMRAFRPWLYSDFIYNFFCPESVELYNHSKEIIWKFLNNIISEKMKALKNNNHEGMKNGLKTFLELLIESTGTDKGYSSVELREETLVLVIAGTDTNAVAVSFTTIMLAKHPEVQEKVYQELQEVFGDSDRPVSPEDLPGLKYLEAVIKETLRLYPPFPFMLRKVEKDFTLPSGVTIVAGCGVLVSALSIHRNRHYWGEDAELFRPERFFNSPLTHPAAFIPFSHGPRGCLGYQYAMMSMKTALASLLRQYRITVPDDIYDSKTLKVKYDIMMKDVHGYVIQLDLRTYFMFYLSLSK